MFTDLVRTKHGGQGRGVMEDKVKGCSPKKDPTKGTRFPLSLVIFGGVLLLVEGVDKYDDTFVINVCGNYVFL